MAAHRKLHPNHKFGEKFRLCLGCLVELPSGANDKEVTDFLTKHIGHEQGQSVNTKKSRQYFSARKATVYLKSRQRTETKVDLDYETSSEEEEEAYISEGGEDSETAEAVANIEDGAAPTTSANMEVGHPAPQLDGPWINHTDMITDLGGETPLQLTQEEYNIDVKDLDPDLVEIFSQKASPPKALQPFKAPLPPLPEATSQLEVETVFEVGSADWATQNRLSLKGRICDRDANLRTMQDKLKQAEGKITALEKNLTAFQAKEFDLMTRENIINSTELVLNNATEKVEKRQKANEEEKERLLAEKKANEEEKKRLLAEKERLRQQDAKLEALGKQLKAFRNKMATKELLLHIPCGRDGITADPSMEGCVIASGEACGHIQLRASVSNGIRLVSYFNTKYNKRPATTTLHQPPAVKIKQQKQ